MTFRAIAALSFTAGCDPDAPASKGQEKQIKTAGTQLGNPDAKIYAEKRRELYGEPAEISDTASEGGATWETWNVDEIQFRLYQQYELCSLQITKLS